MDVIPTNMPTDDFRPMADHRRQRNMTRLVGLARRTSIPLNHQSGLTSEEMTEENTESSMPRVKKKIKHKRMWDEPEAQASEVQNTTSKRPDRIKTRRRLVVPSSSTARAFRTVVIQEDPYYDFGKKIKHTSSSTVGLQNVLDSEAKTSMKSPIVVPTSEEDGLKNAETAQDKLVVEPPHNSTTAPRTRTSNRNHNSTSNNNLRRSENLTECAYSIARFSRRNNKSRSQREVVRCLPVAAESDVRMTRILSTVVTSVSSVKGNQKKNDTLLEPGLEMTAVTPHVAPDYASTTTVFPSFGATSAQQFSSTLSPVESTVPVAHPKHLRSRYRNISLPEYLEITKVNQRRLNVSTEAAGSTAITSSTIASSFLPSVDNTENVEVMSMTSDKSLPTTTNSPASSGPPSDIQDFIYLNNGTSESPVDTDTPNHINEAVGARQHRPPLVQRNITRLSNAEHDVGVVYSEGLATSTYLLSLLAIVPLVMVIVFAFCKLAIRRKRKKVFDSSEYSSEYNRSPLDFNTITSSPITTKLPRVPQHIVWDVSASPEKTLQSPPPPPPPITSLPSNSRWEFRREKLRLQTILGQGNFGQVWKAEADDISGHEGLTRLVAVKMVKEDAASREREDLIRELSIMQHLGSHQNVVTLLGCCTEKGMTFCNF